MEYLNQTAEDKSELKAIIASLSKELFRTCEKAQVPMFLATCTKERGYQCRCLLPGEFANAEELGDQPDRFVQFLRTVVDYDKGSYTVQINE